MHTVKKKPAREIIGKSYQGPKRLSAAYASKDLPVLFIGDTGSGKDLFIEFYMDNNPRKGPKRIINCAAVSPTLLESEVFGHLPGAFTGASRRRKGYLEECAAGVLCLDEIGDAPPYFQEAILRVAEGHPFYKVGADDPTQCTALLIAATNKPEKVKPELRYRFHLVPIPHLCKGDIPALSEYFLRDHAKGRHLKLEVLMELCQQSYPGNVRELKRQCEAISAEWGDRLFGTRKPEVKFHPTDYEAVLPLDYERYLKEFRIWNKSLAPLIEEFNLKFRYKYQPFGGINDGFFEPLLTDPVNKFDFWTVLEAARIGISEIVDPSSANFTKTRGTFARIMQQIIAKKQLPCLLAHMDKEGQSRSPKVVNVYEYAPQLINLLSLPIHNAERQFAEIYFSYLEAAYPDSNAALSHSGLTEDAFKKRKQRLKAEM